MREYRHTTPVKEKSDVNCHVLVEGQDLGRQTSLLKEPRSPAATDCNPAGKLDKLIDNLFLSLARALCWVLRLVFALVRVLFLILAHALFWSGVVLCVGIAAPLWLDGRTLCWNCR